MVMWFYEFSEFIVYRFIFDNHFARMKWTIYKVKQQGTRRNSYKLLKQQNVI